jgi:hypothetical protein
MAGRYTFLALVGLFFGFMFLLSNFETWKIQDITEQIIALWGSPLALFYLSSFSSPLQPPSQLNLNLEPYKTRIVAVGDLHGDSFSAQKVLKFSGVVDDEGDWTGNVDMLVQTGDIIDRFVCPFPLVLFLCSELTLSLCAVGTIRLSSLPGWIDCASKRKNTAEQLSAIWAIMNT